jgi:multisubunit Na+/H+ antiporter MnhB subunit
VKPVAALTVIVELITPTVLVVAAFLLVSGHDRPGGGFIAGLVLAAVPAIRHAAGLGIPAPTQGIQLLGAGVSLAALVAAIGLVVGDPMLTQYATTWQLPVLGQVKASTIVVFDAGVAAVVVGSVTTAIGLLDRDPAADPAPGREDVR